MNGTILGPGSGWFLLGVLAVLLIVQRRRGAQRLVALNQALHEIRRPLQALALSTGAGSVAVVPKDHPKVMPGNSSLFRGSVWQMISAVGDLDHQLNGVPGRHNSRELFACRLMVDACVRRWQARAHLAGAEIRLRWAGPDVLVRGDGTAISGAVENLIVNAIEHGGPSITVNGLGFGRWVRVEVIDSGRAGSASESQSRPPKAKRPRHGHGLELVRGVAADHDGKLDISLSNEGSKAVFVLPASSATPARETPVRVNW